MCELSESEYQATYYRYTSVSGDQARRNPTKKTWVTRNGVPIPVRKMTDSHLFNTIRFLRRSAFMRIMAEVIRMPEDVPDEVVDELAAMSDDEYLTRRIPTFRAMMKEAVKRKLQI